MNELKSYTLKEVSEITGLSMSTIYKYAQNGKLKAVKFGPRKWSVSQQALNDFTNNIENEKVYTLKQVSEILNIEMLTLYKYVWSGKLKLNKIGWEYRIKESMVKGWIKDGIKLD